MKNGIEIIIIAAVVLLLITTTRARADDLKIRISRAGFYGGRQRWFEGASSPEVRSIMRRSLLYFYPKDDTPGFVLRKLAAFVMILGLSAILKRLSMASVTIPLALTKNLSRSTTCHFFFSRTSIIPSPRRTGPMGYLWPASQTFVIDKRGTIVYINRSVKPATHSRELQNVLAQL